MSESPRQYAYLRITSTVIDPDRITQQTGLMPNQQWRVGEQTPVVGRPAKFHHWQLDSGIEPSDDFHEHVAAVAGKVVGKEGAIRSLIEDCSVQLQIVRYLEGTADVGLSLSLREIDFLARTGASLSVDDYDVGSDT